MMGMYSILPSSHALIHLDTGFGTKTSLLPIVVPEIELQIRQLVKQLVIYVHSKATIRTRLLEAVTINS